MENNDWQSTEHRAMQRHTAAMRLLLDAGLRADRRGFSQAAALLCILCERPELERLAEAYGLAERMLGATPQQLERNLRVAIREAWERSDRALLRRLLPWCSDTCPPETKGFLFGLAARLRASNPEDVLPRSGGNGEREAGNGARTADVPPEAAVPAETGVQAESITSPAKDAQAEPAVPEEAPAPTGNGV